MKHYSNTFKSKIIAEYNNGVKVAEISKKYDIGQSTLYHWLSTANVDRRNNPVDISKLQDVLKMFSDGYSAAHINAKTGVSIATCYAWKHKYKNTSTLQAYTKQFKRNVINSIHDGHSKHEVCKSYSITTDVVNAIIEEFKNGQLDEPKAKATSQPAIQTMSVAALDNFTDVLKLLVGKGLDIDSAIDVSKQLSSKMK